MRLTPLLAPLYRCLIVLVPIGMFIILEMIAKGDESFGRLLTSPEWSIGVVFLSLEGLIALQDDRDVFKSIWRQLINLMLVTLIVAASISCFTNLQGPTLLGSLTQLLLLAAAIFSQFVIVGAVEDRRALEPPT